MGKENWEGLCNIRTHHAFQLCHELKGHRQPQVFAGVQAIGAIFCNTETSISLKVKFHRLTSSCFGCPVASNFVNIFLNV